MRYKNWELGGFDRSTAVKFYREGINPLISVLLASRGISDIRDVHALLGDDPTEIYDPFLMADMDKAVTRILAAVRDGERVAIYGDYDVDGMTSCALLAHWLHSKDTDYEIYIPGRFYEGYGLNCPALDALKARGAGLVITVDCGTTAVAEAEYARSIGLGLVITDHHECKPELPAADAVVNPKRPDCGYPHNSLAGVGVVFKLVCALEGKSREDEVFKSYSDLVAIGTVADVMPVIGENRELIRRGLRAINSNPRPGLRQLLRESLPDSNRVTASSLGFIIAPRLNAAGRMGQTGLSVDILMTEDDAQAEKLSQELNRLNTERRALEAEIHEEATAMLAEHGFDGPIVLAKRGWYQGVAGIVAAKMTEYHLFPTIIICVGDDGIGRGSCRSIGTFGIYAALQSCEDILEDYGGHEMAAGVTICEDNINELRRRLADCYHNSRGVVREPCLRIDFEVMKPELLNHANIKSLALLEPFGYGNPQPTLCIRDALLSGIYSIGAGKHTRFKIEKSGRILDCTYFSMPSDKLLVRDGMRVDLVFEPHINEFRGRANVQLNVIDVRAAHGSDRK